MTQTFWNCIMGSLRIMAIDDICQRGSIRDADVAMLSRTYELEPHLSAGDVDALFRIHTMARIQDPAWADFFIETMTDYVVREMEPSGYVTSAQAGWLMARVSVAGRVRSKAEYGLLLNVVDKARWVPESLMIFALTQIRDAIVSGAGPLRSTAGSTARTVTSSDIEQMRQLLYSYGAERPAALTQAEIDLLLDIDSAMETGAGGGADVAPAWADLFEKALSSAILAASGYAGPSREESLREISLAWRAGQVNDGRHSVIAEARGVLVFYRQLSSEAQALSMLERQRIEIITGEPVRPADAAKLAARLCGPDATASSRAVLAVLASVGTALAPAFGAASQAIARPVEQAA